MLVAASSLVGLAACGSPARPQHLAARPRSGSSTLVPLAELLAPTPSAPSATATPAPSAASATPAPAAAVPAAGDCPAAPYGPLRYSPSSGRTVALTFDDGPGGSTAAILAVLARYGVPATFFNIGANMAVRPALVREEAAAGYVLGDHTWDHPNMTLLSAGSQAAELDRVTAEQRALTGTVPCLFRPPYGDYNSTTLALAQERRMAVWMWSVDTQDWMANGSGSAYWVQRIISLAETEGGQLPNPVVLMHNQPIGNPATVSALPTIIEFFRARGYTFVTL
jgi:peptidoglycan/xylan/chitin deacetylase (PgdA/CDA1 family)